MRHTLRDYQVESLTNLRRSIKDGNRAIVLQLPTAGGKTTIAAEVMKGAVNKGRRAWFVVDSVELIDQAYDRFVAEGLGCGVIRGNDERTDYSQPVQVATIQTLRNRWDQVAKKLRPDVIVIDECHVFHQAHVTLMAESRKEGAVTIGLSATPWRKGLGLHFDSIVVGSTTQELTDLGYLAPAIYYAPGKAPDLSGVKTSKNGDWQEDDLAEVMGDAELVADIVQTWQLHASDRQTLVFACNVGHSKSLKAEFVKAGIVAEHIDGYMNDPVERKRIIDDYRAGKIQVLLNCQILIKGFDAPETSALVFARPTKSLMLHYQMMGRGLRIAPGKDDCIILDHAGNIRNGLPTDTVPAQLDDGKLGHQLDRKQPEKDEPLAKPCPSCQYVSQLHKCPKCGFAPERRDDVEVREGVLYPVTEVKEERWSPSAVQELYAQMLYWCRMKGWKDGAAFHMCREFVGRAPRNTRQIQPLQPTQEALGIIKHIMIKRAKGNQS